MLKNLLRKGIKYITSSDYRFLLNSSMGLTKDMPDEEFLIRKYKAYMGRDLSLQKPVTFNEKLQWLKLHDRRPEYTAVRQTCLP